MEPLPPVPPLGAFPPVEALEPMESCGTTITFDSAVLFDFDKSDIRPDAAASAVIGGRVDAAPEVLSRPDITIAGWNAVAKGA